MYFHIQWDNLYHKASLRSCCPVLGWNMVQFLTKWLLRGNSNVPPSTLIAFPIFLSLCETLSKSFSHHSSWATALHEVCSSNHLVPQLQQEEARLDLQWLWKSLHIHFSQGTVFHYISKFSLSLSFSLPSLLRLLSGLMYKMDQSWVQLTFAWLKTTPHSVSPGWP